MSVAGLRPRARAALGPLDRPLTSYYLIIGTSGLLLAVGLVMVLSTSSASQLDDGGSPYSVFVKQLIGALAGLATMWVLARTPPRLLRAVAYPLLIAAMISLMLVLAFGTSVYGAERWIEVGGVQIQPSEFAKLALLLWGADLLARKEELRQLNDWRTLLIPLLPAAAVLAMLVMLGDDLGTTFLLLVILLALLWVIGTPARLFACILGLIIFTLLILVVVQPYRYDRLMGYLNPSGGPTGQNQQGIQGRWAIGSGGLFGVGLGDSKEKWGWVPNATNDFIFAILGEELGLIGTGCVVLLYAGFAYAGLRVARRMADPFMRLAAAGVTAWILVQALVNICAVVGLLPITGVPLPLVSAGLSSLLATMAAIGMLLSFARREPGARETLALAAPRWRFMPWAAPGRDFAAARAARFSPDGVLAGRGQPPGRGEAASGPPDRARGSAARGTLAPDQRARPGSGSSPGRPGKAKPPARQAPACPRQAPARPRQAPARPRQAPAPGRPGKAVPAEDQGRRARPELGGSGQIRRPDRSRLAEPGSGPIQGRRGVRPGSADDGASGAQRQDPPSRGPAARNPVRRAGSQQPGPSGSGSSGAGLSGAVPRVSGPRVPVPRQSGPRQSGPSQPGRRGPGGRGDRGRDGQARQPRSDDR